MDWFFTSRRGITAFVLILCIANFLFFHFNKEWQQSFTPQSGRPAWVAWEAAIMRFSFTPSGMIISVLITLAFWVLYLSRFRHRRNDQTQIYLFGLGMAGIGSILVRILIWPT